MKRPPVIAFIPARGGSKGIPRKNLQLLGGKPLIAYSIETALNAKLVERVIVNTEDPEIAEIARQFEAEVPFLRPQHLATDSANLSDALAFALNWLEEKEGSRLEVFVQLFPTCPFRTPALIDHLVDKVLNGPYKGAITVKPIKKNGEEVNYFSITDDGYLRPAVDVSSKKMFTFNHMGQFRPFMLVGVYSVFMPGPPEYIHIVNNPISQIDIDNPRDLALSRAIIKEGHFDFYGKGI